MSHQLYSIRLKAFTVQYEDERGNKLFTPANSLHEALKDLMGGDRRRAQGAMDWLRANVQGIALIP